MRKHIPERGPFRYIHKADTVQTFDNRLRSLNNLELGDFYSHNIENRHVFVYEFDGRILCILVFDDKYDHFYLNLIENNQFYEKECDMINPAPKLISYVEKIAKSYGHKKIRLDALEQLVPYYTKLGYFSMNKVRHRKYGVLVKMMKLFGN
jgi:hypothetical protein